MSGYLKNPLENECYMQVQLDPQCPEGMDGNVYSCKIIQNNQNLDVLKEVLGENLKYKLGAGGSLMTGGVLVLKI